MTIGYHPVLHSTDSIKTKTRNPGEIKISKKLIKGDMMNFIIINNFDNYKL